MNTVLRALPRTLTSQYSTLTSRCSVLTSRCSVLTSQVNAGASGLVVVRSFQVDSSKQAAKRSSNKKLAGAFNFLEETLEKKFEGRAPSDDVWIRKYYPPPRYSLLEAVAMHREAAVPEIHNNQSATLILNCKLDLRTRKKTKFMKEFKHTILLPHYFEDGEVHRMLVLCKNVDDKNLAENLGAEYCGGVDLVKAIMKGDVRHDDYDHVICATDFYDEIGVLRKHLRDRYPSPKAGSVGTDIRAIFEFFTQAKTYESRNVQERFGKLRARFATLDMSNQQILENYERFIEDICSVKAANLGQFVVKASLECPPSPEHFLLNEKDLLPKTQRGKTVKLVQDEEPPPKSEDDDDDDIQAQTVGK